jgi:hypothetical protein
MSQSCPIYGGAERDRTADLLVANEALSQLSYSPPPNPHRTLLSQAQRSRNNISECTSNHPCDSTNGTSQSDRYHSTDTTLPVTEVPAANGFSTTCHTSPASIITPSTGTTNLAPLRATASNTPTSPTTNSVRSSAICHRCLPATRDSSRISVTTPENSLTSKPPKLPTDSPPPSAPSSRACSPHKTASADEFPPA